VKAAVQRILIRVVKLIAKPVSFSQQYLQRSDVAPLPKVDYQNARIEVTVGLIIAELSRPYRSGDRHRTEYIVP